MRTLRSLLIRFGADERGAFLVIFGVLAIVLVATAGAVVDFTTIEQARTRAQDALDSAALGLQPQIFETGITKTALEERLRGDAQDLMVERLTADNVAATVTSASLNVGDGSLRLNASVVVPTAFVSLIGYPEITATLVSEATRKRLNVEVAMVLDNSYSMTFFDRMANLKLAAKCAMNVLFNGDCNSTAVTATQTSVKIGIVPFTEFVNVGTANANATWMDTTGASSIANDNFDDDSWDGNVYSGTVNRFTLYNQLTNSDWNGCVEARPYPYDTNDALPDPLVPDTLFVPEFAPDNPDSGYSNSYMSDAPGACKAAPRYVHTQVKTKCNTYISGSGSNKDNQYSNMTCSGGTTTNTYQTFSTTNVASSATSTRPATLNTDPGTNSDPGANNYSTTYSTTSSGGGTYRYTVTRVRTWTYQYSDRELQERLCKYTGSISTSGGKGPDWDCPTNALTPLTNTKATVKSAIEAMYPQTYTNIHQGTIWGFHMLSPTPPLTEGSAYNTATYKVMIIMTDGENTVQGYDSTNMNKSDGYLAYGYPGPPTATVGDTEFNGRIYGPTYPTPTAEAEVTTSMNERTMASCASAKAAGITVYTIGLNAPTQATIDMLDNCATSLDHSYFPTQSSELITVFQDIAQQLADLRLAL